MRPGTIDGTPAPRTGLDRATVASEALELLEERGLEALSIRALASRLDVSPMHLYRFFRDKEELLDLVTDAALGSDLVPPLDPDLDWHTELAAACRRVWERFRHQPETARLILSRPSVTANGFRAVSGILAILGKGGIGDDRAIALYQLLRDFCMSSAVASSRRDRPSLQRVLDHAPPEASGLLAAFDRGSIGDPAAQFEIGLAVLLAGLDQVYGRELQAE
ncbi:MAG TPA: TetR/AcrR family transcriptional regulator C-terminal domain-containing protein [Acidimicrobiales bacterium]|nr:TetR/AcrR family transcriptional regulator C-terminal domain-containing protein [Acidimicrobiales bacterium]